MSQMTALRQYCGWGEEAVPALIKLLQSLPWIDVQIENNDLELDDLDLDPDTVKIIQKRAKAKLDMNMEHARKAIAFSPGLFIKMCESFLATSLVRV